MESWPAIKQGRRRFHSVTVLAKRRGHQTEFITTDHETEAAGILRGTFSRWGQEDYFKYETAHRSLALLGSYRFQAHDHP